jgi:SAM-dependent methyltransferase
MARDRGTMGPDVKETPVILNFGCGFAKMQKPAINVDAFEICKPDILHDLNNFPYPWEDNSVDCVFAFHIMEHLDDWWMSFIEISRILKLGGILEMRVPDESSTSAGTYRDHKHIISIYSFCGLQGSIIQRHNTNAWAASISDSVPMKMESLRKVPFPEFNWLAKWFPKIFRLMAYHARNFIWEQRFVFRKVAPVNHGDPKIWNLSIPDTGSAAK